jgi:hypothetical protein
MTLSIPATRGSLGEYLIFGKLAWAQRYAGPILWVEAAARIRPCTRLHALRRLEKGSIAGHSLKGDNSPSKWGLIDANHVPSLASTQSSPYGVVALHLQLPDYVTREN